MGLPPLPPELGGPGRTRRQRISEQSEGYQPETLQRDPNHKSPYYKGVTKFNPKYVSQATIDKALRRVKPGNNFANSHGNPYTTDARPPKVRRGLKLRDHTYIAFCEQFYHQHSKAPSNEQAAIALNWPLSEVQYILLNLNVQEALDARGIQWRENSNVGVLTPIQIATANLLANFSDVRPINVKLDSLGVNSQQYQGWLRDKTFQEYVQSLATNAITNIRPAAITSLANLVQANDFSATRYYLEVTGEFKQQETADLQRAIQVIVESVQRHVRDPQVLAAISSDLLQALPGAASHSTIDMELENGEPENYSKELERTGRTNPVAEAYLNSTDLNSTDLKGEVNNGR